MQASSHSSCSSIRPHYPPCFNAGASRAAAAAPVLLVPAAAVVPAAVLAYAAHNQQIPGMGLQDAVQRLRCQHLAGTHILPWTRMQQQQQHWPPGAQVENQYVQQGGHSQQSAKQQQQPSKLLHRPSKGFASPQQVPPTPQQQQQQPLPQQHQHEQGSRQQHQLQPPGEADRWLAAAIADATTLQQLQQLVPHLAAAGRPSVAALLLLQAVRIAGSSSRGSTTTSSSTNSSSTNSSSSAVPQGGMDTEVHQLLVSVGLVLAQQSAGLQFQQLSAILWAWSQVRTNTRV